MSKIFKAIFGDGGKEAADATTEAAGVSAEAQREALEYLKEAEAVPRQYREGALGQLGGLVGIGDNTQQKLIDQAQNSPLYSAIMGQRDAGEDAILRNASATGGLRSGDASANLSDYGMQLENKALLDSYNQQVGTLTGLSGLPSNVNNIAATTSGIGQTLGLGISGAAQARQAGGQQRSDNVLGAAKFAASFSDIRLKENIKFETTKGNHNIYSWDWKPEAVELGLSGRDVGVLAHEVYEYMPEAISEREGFIAVDYSMLEVH